MRDLFRRTGYSATGLNDIVEAFRRAQGFALPLLQPESPRSPRPPSRKPASGVVETLEKLAKENAPTGDLLKAHAKLLGGWLKTSGFRAGCPITTVLLELAPEDRAVTNAGRKAYADRLAVLKEKLVARMESPSAAPNAWPSSARQQCRLAHPGPHRTLPRAGPRDGGRTRGAAERLSA